ncbi:hypothetical protein OC861_003998, partial [Tilletia horrida]
MLKRFLLLGALLCALIGVVQAGLWAAALFWFGLAQFASTFHDLVANCDGLRSCLAGSIEALFYAGLTVTTGYKTQWKPFGARSMNNGVYHLYEPGHPDLRHKDFKAAGLTPLIDSITDGAKPFIHHLKPSHIGKEREATMIFHHKDGTKRQMLYHFNNETVTHQVLASWHSVKEDEDFVTHNIKREQVGINDGMGMAFHDMDGDDWRNVDQGRNDVAYWNTHTLDQMSNANADSFCMGFNDPNRNGEHVAAMRAQPANENTYGGVNFNNCGSDNFRRRRSGDQPRSGPVKDDRNDVLTKARASLKRKIGIDEKPPV